MAEKSDYYIDKRITVLVDDNKYFYTIKKVLHLSDAHILFKDREDRVKGFRFKDILEIF